jgi:uncharacterized protein YbaR (Trm112 family)
MIEHAFVTRKTWEESRELLMQLLRRFGFRLASTCLGCGGGDDPPHLDLLDPACPRCRQPRKITFRNQLDATAGGPKTFSRPIWLAVEYHRGRVELAGAVETGARSSKKDELVLYKLVDGVQRVLESDADVYVVYRDWLDLKHNG